MNTRIVCLFFFCVPAVLLFAGCGGTDGPVIPVTGADSTVPAVIEAARGNALEYLISSSRLAVAPSGLDWQLDEEQFDGEYRYHSGDWLMVIWYGDTEAENQRIVVVNQAENIHWCGYVKPDGEVVDTSYMP